MSAIAEFAPALHAQLSVDNMRSILPASYPAGNEKLLNVRAVVFDVYGTMVNYWKSGFADPAAKEEALVAAFRATIERFDFGPWLSQIHPDADPASTLKDFYLGLIGLQHDKAIAQGKVYPEVRIEEIWSLIIMMFERRGYIIPGAVDGFPVEDRRDFAKCVAYFYNFTSLGRGLYPGVVSALEDLSRAGMKLGIVSNAQFYTPIDLTLFFRDQSADALDDHLELFARDMVVHSYEEGVSKPNPKLFQRVFDALFELEILPEQTVFVGNDLLSDVKYAQDLGMRTALFTGDAESLFLHDAAGEIVPDLVFSKWSDLPQLLSVNMIPATSR